jgi:hypothetical protein
MMLNTVLSKQCHVDFRTARFSLSLLQQQARPMVFSSPWSIRNIAAAAAAARCYHHPHHHSPWWSSDITRKSPLYPSATAPEAKSEGFVWHHSSSTGGLLTPSFQCQFQQHMDERKASYRSFASNSKSNNRRNTDQRRKSEPSGHQPMSVQSILDDYMQNHEKLTKPFHVSSVWSQLWKAVQMSPNKWERHNFWIHHKASLQTLVDHTIRSADQFNERSTATATHSLVKLLHLTNSTKKILGGGELHSLWKALVNQTKLHIQSDGFNAQSLSNLLWAYATATADGVKVVDGRLLNALAKSALIVGIADFKPQDLAIVSWAFATLKHKTAPWLFEAIAPAAQVRINEFNPQALSNIAWAFAKLHHEAPSLLDAIARAAQVRIGDFNPQALSNTAWAFAKLHHEAPSLFNAIAPAAQVRIGDFNSQNLSNTAWAFAKLHHEAPSLFNAIARAAQVRMGDFNAQNHANTAWAFATMNHEAPSLFDAIARAAQVRIGDFNAQNLSNTAWAYGKMNHSSPLLFDAIARAAQIRINEFSPWNLSSTAWAYGKMNHSSPLLFEAIARAAPVRINDFDPHALSDTARAFATLNHKAPFLFDAISTAAQRRINEFNQQELSMLEWAFATLNIESPSLFEAIARATTPVRRINEFKQQQEDLANNNKMEPNTVTHTVSSILLKSCKQVVMQIGHARRKVQQTMRQWWF